MKMKGKLVLLLLIGLMVIPFAAAIEHGAVPAGGGIQQFVQFTKEDDLISRLRFILTQDGKLAQIARTAGALRCYFDEGCLGFGVDSSVRASDNARLESVLTNVKIIVDNVGLTSIQKIVGIATELRAYYLNPADAGNSLPVNNNAGLLSQQNMVYRGAFRVPQGVNAGSTFEWGGETMAFRPDGDLNGPDDGTSGSIFMTSHPYQEHVAEISIPALLDQRDVGVDGLNTASFIQNFADITEGKAESLDGGNGFRVSGLAYLPQQGSQDGSKLYWTARRYYNVDDLNQLSHGMSNPDFQNLESAGLWRLGSSSFDSESRSQRTAGYLLTIPEIFANNNLGGRRLASGLFTQQGIATTSVGPALYAYAPWLDDPVDGSPAPDSSLGYTPLMYYPCLGLAEPEGCLSDFSNYRDDDAWLGATWVDTEQADAVIVVGRRATSAYYGDARPDDCTPDKGYHGNPYLPSILFYNPEDFADVAAGRKDPTSLQPYLEWNPSEFFQETCQWMLTGAVYDSTNSLLYVSQYQADGDYPLVYVFEVQ